MAYLFESRLKSRIERISWFIIYIIPVFILVYAPSSIDVLIFIIMFLIAILSFFSLYEAGYIENDIKTTINEVNPTIRIDKSKQFFLEKNYYFVQVFKIIVTILLLSALKLLADNFGVKLYWLQFIICLFFMRLSFYTHNRIRNRLNILTFMCLSVSKYFSIILLFLPFKNFLYLLVLAFLIFPLLRTLEHATKPKYELPILIKIIGNHDIFRVKYYFVMFLLSIILFLTLKNDFSILALTLMTYFLIYRVSALIFLNKKAHTMNSVRKKRYIK